MPKTPIDERIEKRRAIAESFHAERESHTGTMEEKRAMFIDKLAAVAFKIRDERDELKKTLDDVYAWLRALQKRSGCQNSLMISTADLHKVVAEILQCLERTRSGE